MVRYPAAATAGVALVAAIVSLLLATAPAGAAASCDRRILTDWSDNGRIDGVYSLSCYEDAIDALPVDLRDYTNAEEVIGRALTAALRADPPRSVDVETGRDAVVADASSLPVLPLVGGAFALALVVAGGISYVVRRRSAG